MIKVLIKVLDTSISDRRSRTDHDRCVNNMKNTDFDIYLIIALYL